VPLYTTTKTITSTTPSFPPKWKASRLNSKCDEKNLNEKNRMYKHNIGET
jgi:hypothetical protein